MIYKANLVDIHANAIYPAKIVVEGARIVSIETIATRQNSYILPGFIDAHIHIESSMLVPSRFAALALPHGTVATVSDPHEIANVLGVSGVEFMLEDAKHTPLKCYFGAPSCVPATDFETSGATLGVREIERLLQNPQIRYLSEVMNFPGVLAEDADLLAKIEAAKRQNAPIDGHAPALRGERLQRYIDAGITTDHEASTLDEAREKLERGMYILIREGSAAKNFDALAPLIDDYYERLMFCSDDRHADDLQREHINALVIRALRAGHDLFKVLRIACINPITHYNLDVGRLRVGDRADFIEVEDLERFSLIRSVIDGKIVVQNGIYEQKNLPITPPNNFHAKKKRREDFAFTRRCASINVIGARDRELLTDALTMPNPAIDGASVDIRNDILKIAVVNRYKESPPSVSFIHGFGLEKGAIASSVAHDSHNIVCVGCDDDAMAQAVNHIVECRGGIVAVADDDVRIVPLEVAGLMSMRDGADLAASYTDIVRFTKERLGCKLDAPFMTLSFMALLVIPSLKISDRGVFDADRFDFVGQCSD